MELGTGGALKNLGGGQELCRRIAMTIDSAMLSSFMRGRVCTNEGDSCQEVVNMKPAHRNSSRWSKTSPAIASTPAQGAYSSASSPLSRGLLVARRPSEAILAP